ncbi:unnamed protein product, partial [Tenebrio molitor]
LESVSISCCPVWIACFQFSSILNSESSNSTTNLYIRSGPNKRLNLNIKRKL